MNSKSSSTVGLNPTTTTNNTITSTKTFPNTEKILSALENEVLPSSDVSMPYIASGLGTGLGVGILMNKVGLDDPKLVKKQIQMKNFLPVKTYLATIGTGCLALSLMSMQKGGVIFPTRPTNVLLSIVGGSLAGAGVAMTGSTPNLLWAQLGRMRPGVIWTFLGAIAGTAAHTLLTNSAMWRSWFVENFSFFTLRHSTLNASMNLPYHYVALPFAAAIGGALYFIETLYPNENDLEGETVIAARLPSNGESGSVKRTEMDTSTGSTKIDNLIQKTRADSWMPSLQREKWNPYVSGALYGLLFLPSYFVTRNLFENLTYQTIVFNISRLFSSSKSTPTVGTTTWTKELVQFLFDAGIVVGSMLATKMLASKAKTMLVEEEKRSKQLSTEKKAMLTLGGFLVLFGFKMAAVSDVSPIKLHLGSMITIASACTTALMIGKK